tara:strand:- start:1717 stop:3504 length:1788 start_codon:yes stop_codon:yes gene_type:complete
MKEQTKNLIFLSAVLVCLITFFLAVYNNTVSSIPVEADFGLLSVVSPFWFIALGIAIGITLFTILKSEKNYQFILALLLLIFVIYALPIFVEVNPRSADTFWHTNSVFEIIHGGTLDFDFLESGDPLLDTVYNSRIYYLIYNPGAFVAYALLFLPLFFAGIEPIIVMKFFSLISILLMTLLAYFLFDKLIPKRKLAQLVTFFFFLGNVYIQNHVSPQTLGLIFMLVILICFVSLKENIKWIGLLLALMLITIHLPSALFIFLLIAFNLLYCYLFSKDNKFVGFEHLLLLFLFYALYSLLFTPDLVLTLLDIGLTWFFPIIGVVLCLVALIWYIKSQKINLANQTLLNIFLGFLMLGVLVLIFLGSFEEMNLARGLRFFVLIGLSSFALFLTYLLMKEKKVSTVLILAISFLTTAFLFFIFQFFLTSAFGLEDRAFLVFYFGIVLLLGIAMKDLKISLNRFIFFITILLVLNASTFYYHENHFLIPENNFEGWHHVYGMTNTNSTIFGNIDSYSMYYIDSFNSLSEIRKVDKYNHYAGENKELIYDVYIVNNFNAFAHYLEGNLEDYYDLEPALEQEYNLVFNSDNTFLVYTSQDF